MKFIKAVSLIIILIFALGGLMFFFLGASLVSIGKTIEAEANKPVSQQILTTNGIEIKVPLKEEYSLSFKNIKLCTPTNESKNNFFKKVTAENYGTYHSCFNDICNVDITLNNLNHYPQNVNMYISENNICEKKTVNYSEGEIGIYGYSARIEMSEELIKVLNLGEVYQVKPKYARTHSAWQMMGTKKVDMSYVKKPNQEVLLIDNVERAKIIFE